VRRAPRRRVSPAEVAGRARQALARGLERYGLAGRRRSRPHAVFAALLPEGEVGEMRARAEGGDPEGAARALRDRFRQRGPLRFFPGASEPDVARKAGEFPGHRDAVVSAADAAISGRFDLLGYAGLSFGDPVDWHLDPLSGRRAPLVHWSRIDVLDPSVVGDSKVTWELNRHQWLVGLGQAYRLTGDERYAGAAARAFEHWLRANPPGIGINWASSLEASLRIISWCWTLVLIRDSEVLSPARFEAALQAVWIHAAHVERHLSTYFSPNTHLTGEALGLFYAGVLFPELRPAARWRATGLRLLVAESRRQVHADGVHFELSTCYQRYMLETHLHLLVLARRNAVPVPAEVEEHARLMTDFLVAVRRPDGTVPQIGDGDGGDLMPLARRGPEDLRGVFATAAALWGRPDHAWAAGGPAPETLWMLGDAGQEAWRALQPSPPVLPASRLFPNAGYVVMRSGWDADSHQLVFDAGPMGCPLTAGHGHADLLSIQCAAFGETFLVDPGTGSYVNEDGWRSFFRGTAAHSTVTVDGEGQARPLGPFVWDRRPAARLLAWRIGGHVEFAEGEHDAYRRLLDPVRHRRRVLFVERRFWVVIDDLQGAAPHEVEVRFQFAPLPVAPEGEGWVRALGRRRGLLVRALAARPLSIRVGEGRAAPREGWFSGAYGRLEPAPMVVYAASGPLPLRIATLVVPLRAPDDPRPDIRVVMSAGDLAAVVVGDSRVDFEQVAGERDGGFPVVSGTK
jgi:heparinase II/III-like protein